MGFFELYLIFQSSSISGFLSSMAVLTGLVSVINVSVNFVFNDELTEEGHKFLSRTRKFTIPAFIIIAPLSALMPDTESLIAIYSINEVMQYTQNSEEFQKLPDNVVNFMNTYIEEHMDKNEE